MGFMFYVFCIVVVVCLTIIILNRMDTKHNLEKEKLELLKRNPELAKKFFNIS